MKTAIDFFYIMQGNKKLRLNEHGRNFWDAHSRKTWSIQKIHADNELTLVDETHQILEGVSFDQIADK